MKITNHKLQITNAFTLIELLVVISIIGILISVSIFGLSGTRESARDARRKSDLELVKSGLELYKADCNRYPTTLTPGSPLVGNTPPSTCLAINTYMAETPDDPTPETRSYRYRTTASGYEYCASLEKSGLATVDCGGSCGSQSCNYKITNP